MTAYLVVRAVVADPEDRAAFDHWYRTEHLPDAVKAFNARSAMRGWSTNDPSVHTAFYRFDSVEAVRAIGDSAAIKASDCRVRPGVGHASRPHPRHSVHCRRTERITHG